MGVTNPLLTGMILQAGDNPNTQWWHTCSIQLLRAARSPLTLGGSSVNAACNPWSLRGPLMCFLDSANFMEIVVLPLEVKNTIAGNGQIRSTPHFLDGIYMYVFMYLLFPETNTKKPLKIGRNPQKSNVPTINFQVRTEGSRKDGVDFSTSYLLVYWRVWWFRRFRGELDWGKILAKQTTGKELSPEGWWKVREMAFSKCRPIQVQGFYSCPLGDLQRWVQFAKSYSRILYTPPKTNMEPENGPLEKEIPFGNHPFQVPC